VTLDEEMKAKFLATLSGPAGEVASYQSSGLQQAGLVYVQSKNGFQRVRPDGNIANSCFMLLEEFHKAISQESLDRELIHDVHLGYEHNAILKSYADKLKVAFCAVYRSYVHDNQMSRTVVFATAAARFNMSETTRNARVRYLQQALKLKHLRAVWELMEDPVINFFASTFTFGVPNIPVDHHIRISRGKNKQPLKIRYFSKRERKIGAGAEAKAHKAMEPTATNKIAMGVVERMFDVPGRPAAHQATTPSDSANESLPASATLPPVPPASSTSGFFQSLFGGSQPEVNSPPRPASTSQKPTVTMPSRTSAAEYGLILHIHGGGWVSQTPETHAIYLKIWANETSMPIVSLDYDLAPEETFPHALDQAYELYVWLLKAQNRAKLGITHRALAKDQTDLEEDEDFPIVFAGDSAGANLVTALCIRLIEAEQRIPCGLMLSYPALNLTRSVSISRLLFGNDPILCTSAMSMCLQAYLQHLEHRALIDPYISPAFVSRHILAQFPCVAIVVGDIDPVLDDACYFAARLHQDCARKVKLKIYQGLPHGFLNVSAQVPAADNAIKECASLMREFIINRQG